MLAAKRFTIACVISVACLLSAAQPAECANAAAEWPIRTASVRTAIADFLHTHGWRALPETAHLAWENSLAARKPEVELQVSDVAWDTRQQAAQFRLRCRQRSGCVDFLVHIALPPPVAEDWQKRLGPPASSHLSAGLNVSGPLLAQRGKPATLVLEGGGMRISLPVICTEPGGLNQRIRVIDGHSHRVFYADVVGESLLRAAL